MQSGLKKHNSTSNTCISIAVKSVVSSSTRAIDLLQLLQQNDIQSEVHRGIMMISNPNMK